MRDVYTKYKQEYFAKLLDEPIGQQDRNQIRQLLCKPWNPYVLRHSKATEVSRRLNQVECNQWFGWSEKSNVSSQYRHYYGNEAGKKLLESYGLAPQNQQSIPKLRECPNVNCKELNNPDAPFCTKCRVPLTIAGYMEKGHEKDEKISSLEKQMNEIMVTVKSNERQEKIERDLIRSQIKFRDAALNVIMPDWRLKYYNEFHKLSDEELQKAKEFRKELEEMRESDIFHLNIPSTLTNDNSLWFLKTIESTSYT